MSATFVRTLSFSDVPYPVMMEPLLSNITRRINQSAFLFGAVAGNCCGLLRFGAGVGFRASLRRKRDGG